MKSQKGSKGVDYSFFNLGARWEWVVNTTPQLLYPQERDPISILREDVWAPYPFWTGA